MSKATGFFGACNGHDSEHAAYLSCGHSRTVSEGLPEGTRRGDEVECPKCLAGLPVEPWAAQTMSPYEPWLL